MLDHTAQTCHRESSFSIEGSHGVIRKFSIPLAVLLVGLAVPAHAADDAFAAGALAYEKAMKSTSRPSEQSDFAYCSGYWDVWSNAANDGTISEARLAGLPVDLRPPSTSFAAMAMLMMFEDADTVEQQIAPSQKEASQLVAESLAGKVEAAQSLFHSLGICQLEDE